MSELEQLFIQWRKGNTDAFSRVTTDLWSELYSPVLLYLRYLDCQRDREQDVISAAFWDAMEELDLSISGGKLMTDEQKPDEAIDNEAEKEAEKVRVGRVSGRHIKARNAFSWKSDQAFLTLVRKIWVLRARDRFRASKRPRPNDVSLDAPEGSHLDFAADAFTGPEGQLLAKDEIKIRLKRLDKLSASLTRSPACRDLIQDTIQFVKWLIAQYNSRWQGNTVRDIEEASIDDILNGAELGPLDLSGSSWRSFLLDLMTVQNQSPGAKEKARNKLYKRIERCIPRIEQELQTIGDSNE